MENTLRAVWLFARIVWGEIGTYETPDGKVKKARLDWVSAWTVSRNIWIENNETID